MVRICAFGDSITWGAWDEEEGGWVNRLQLSLAPIYNYELTIYNLGISGDTTEDLLKRLENETKARNPDVIIFNIGGNDAGYINSEDNPIVPLERFSSNIQKIINIAKKFTNKIIFLGFTNLDESKTMPVPWDTTTYHTNKLAESYEKTLKDICDKNKLGFIPFYGLLNKEDLDEDDGLHLSNKGHEKIYTKVKNFILKKKII